MHAYIQISRIHLFAHMHLTSFPTPVLHTSLTHLDTPLSEHCVLLVCCRCPGCMDAGDPPSSDALIYTL